MATKALAVTSSALSLAGVSGWGFHLYRRHVIIGIMKNTKNPSTILCNDTSSVCDLLDLESGD
jgi:hypothetical protein